MESFEKSLELLQASHSIECNITSKHSPIPKVSTQNASSMKNHFEDFKNNFIETLNVQAELFTNHKKRIIFYQNEFI